MMIKPGISELSKKVDSRYTLVSMAAKRVRMLGGNPQEAEEIKPISKAVEEIADGKETKNELNSSREIAIFKDGVTL